MPRKLRRRTFAPSRPLLPGSSLALWLVTAAALVGGIYLAYEYAW